ncbi:sarcosine oxidase subunit gamma family protein [Pelagibacteraceae bacterium]|nr:sarcosine oxidase subunit gamma family protein [Pelagibacteraceae bacterium]
MKTVLSLEGVDIIEKNYQQVIIRGDGKNEFNQSVNKEISILPPSKNLEVITNDKYLFAKQSFNQWSLIYLAEQNYKDVLKFISNINSKDEILASDYSYGQIYLEVSGENKNEFLNKLTHFDLRAKKFPVFTLAQTLIARIDCSIYNLKDKYIITCNRSLEDYFKERLKDTADID